LERILGRGDLETLGETGDLESLGEFCSGAGSGAGSVD